MTTRLTLIAQGATEAVRAATFPRDEPLEPRAQTLLAEMGQTPWLGMTARVSPATAAHQTAAALGLRIAPDGALADMSSGAWAGQPIAQIAAADPMALAAFIGEAGFAGHGGESRADLGRRVAGWLAAQAAMSGQIVAVTNVAVIRAAVVHVLGAPDEAFWRLDVAPLTATVFSHDGRRWALRGLGCALE